LVPAAEIRLLREDVPSNLATLCYKAVEKFVKAVENSCRTQQDQNTGDYTSAFKNVKLCYEIIYINYYCMKLFVSFELLTTINPSATLYI